MAEAAHKRNEEAQAARDADEAEAERQRQDLIKETEKQEKLIAERIAKAKRDCERRIRLLKKLDSEK
jgi:hypothetical protein